MYYTGAANTSELMLDAIQSAAVAEGWTIPHRGEDTGGGDTSGPYRPDVLYLRDGSGYDFAVAFEGIGAQENLKVYGINGQHDVGQTTADQAGAVSTTNMAYIPCLKYHLFVESNYLYVVIEGQVGHFRHFGIGQLDKGDSYPGGNFIFGHRSVTSAVAHFFPFQKDVTAHLTDCTFAVLIGGDGNPPIWRTNSSGKPFPDSVNGSIGNSSWLGGDLVEGNVGQFNNRHVFAQLYSFVLRQGGYYSPVGTPPGIRATARLSASSGEVLTLGPDTWRIFPIGKWGSAQAATESGHYAIVYFSD